MRPIWKFVGAAALLAVVNGAWSAVTVPEDDVCDLEDAWCYRFAAAEAYFRQLNPDAPAKEWRALRSQLHPLTDPERLAATMADPQRTAAWLVALSDPDAVNLMFRCAQEPVLWEAWLRVMGNPEKMMRAGLVFMNPMVYLNWMAAPADPRIYAKLAELGDDALHNDWRAKAGQVKFYEPLYAWMDPNWSISRIAWAMNPATYANLFAWLEQTMRDGNATTQ